MTRKGLSDDIERVKRLQEKSKKVKRVTYDKEKSNR